MRKNQSSDVPYGCPLSECMAILGGAWTTNLIWYLSGGPRRFSELKHDLVGISAKMLATRLKELENKAVVHRRVLPTSPPSVEYSLTDLGEELVPAINAIVEVGHKIKVRNGTP
ncbi:winged helix-turn-helix transcriptional regulator [Kiloniella sp.]|uniref:winged helix-turn-helix transcriptional regulator n=1 Tax=Kiloniella sp. TaxID=1938587 RepID=UPI003B0132DD